MIDANNEPGFVMLMLGMAILFIGLSHGTSGWSLGMPKG